MSPLSPMWVDSKELSRLTSISPRSLERLRSDGTIPFYKIGQRMVRYRLDDVKDALEKTKFCNRPYARMRKTLKRDCEGIQDSAKA
jgi:excisionase family DNA binding protein